VEPLNPKNPTRPSQLCDEPTALRRRSSNGVPCAGEDRRRKAVGSFGILSRRELLGFAIIYSIAYLGHAAELAAAGAAPPAATQKAPEKTGQPTRSEEPTFPLRGTVVDEKGIPVPHVQVVTPARADLNVDLATVTDAAGHFTLDVPTWQSLVILWAKDEAGHRIGSLNYVPGKTRPAARIVLHIGRSIPVSVVDGKGQPVSGVKVGVSFAARNGAIFYGGTRQKFVQERTDAQGQTVLRLPPDVSLEFVWAAKAGAGFDYVLYRIPVVQTRAKQQRPLDPAIRAPEDSRPIKFVLGGVHKLRLHVVNERRRPLPGLRIHASFLKRPNRGGGARVSGIDELQTTADSTGTAEFDAIPIEAISDVYFYSGSVGYYIRDSANLTSAETLTELTIVATELPVLRVRVTYADGRPAQGSSVHFYGRQYGRNPFSFSGEGQYHSAGEWHWVYQGDSYSVVTATHEGFASKMEARVARMGEPVRPVHLVLKPATRVHGTLTVGKDRRPAANEPVTLIQRDQDNYGKLPENERLPRTVPLADLAHMAMDIPLYATTDEQGHFEFDAAPGPYLLGAGYAYLNEFSKTKNVNDLFPDGAHEFEIKDEKEIVIDLHREQQKPIKRRVAPTKGLPD
jgi:hypothetical protein